MNRMQDSTASGLGPWLFVTVAFIVTVWLAYRAGRGHGASRDTARPAAPGPAGDSVDTVPLASRPAALDGSLPDPGAAAAPMDWEALTRALAADARPVLLLATNAGSTERRLCRANAAAQALLGLPPGTAGAAGQGWAALEAGAPAALRAALADPAHPGDWWVLRTPDGRHTLALGPAADDPQAETASLVYTVSHDLRAPIRVVDGFTRIVKEDYGRQLDRVGLDHLDRVLAASARMNQMIDAVLTMARLSSQPLSRQSVDLSQLAGFVVEELRKANPEREVQVQLQDGLRARGDPTLLRLVLENLLGNAWKYSARNPQASIAFSATDEPADSATGSPARRVYAVRDNGAGFDMRVADRLFGLFQRLHSAKDFAGTGVGLASVRRIVQRHGGQVWAESEPGRGATFYFTLAD